jgi:biotin carboxyl carrier protein
LRYAVDVNGERVHVTIDGAAITVDDETVSAGLADVEPTPVVVLTIGSSAHRVRVRRHGSRGRYSLWIAGHRYEVEALDERARAIRDLQLARDVHVGPKPVIAPMPGLVVRVLVSERDAVQAGQGLVVVEAMKMENELRAITAGVIDKVHVAAGTAVEKGTLLITLS